MNIVSRSLVSPPEGVRLEYVGRKKGTITFNANGRRYRAGDNARHRIVYAKNEDDVKRLLKYGVFKLVSEKEADEPNKSDDAGGAGSASDLSSSAPDGT